MQAFSVRDKMTVRVHSERFPPGPVKKLHTHTCPCKILRRISSNTYELDIPRDLKFNPIFSPDDYPDVIPDPSSSSTINPHVSISLPSPPLARRHKLEEIKDILEDEIILIADESFQ